MWSGSSAFATIAVVAAFALQTPTPPDLSGRWQIDAARSTAVGGGNGGGQGRGRAGGGGGLARGPSAPELILTQTATSLAVVELRPTAKSRIDLPFDGSQTRYEIVSGESTGQPATSSSQWKGDRLVTVVTVSGIDNGTRVYTEQRYLDNGALVVEIAAAGSSNARKTIYTRKQE